MPGTVATKGSPAAARDLARNLIVNELLSVYTFAFSSASTTSSSSSSVLCCSHHHHHRRRRRRRRRS